MDMPFEDPFAAPATPAPAAPAPATPAPATPSTPPDDLLAQLTGGGGVPRGQYAGVRPEDARPVPEEVAEHLRVVEGDAPVPPEFEASLPPPPLPGDPPKLAPDGELIGGIRAQPKLKLSYIPKLFKTREGEVVRFDEKRRRTMKAISGTDSMKAAAARAGVSVDYVKSTFKLPAVQQYFRALLAKADVTDTLIAQRIREGLDATIQKEYLTKEGDVVQGEEKVDFEQRGRYIDRALALQGLNKPEEKTPEDGKKALVDLSKMSAEELKAFADALMKSAPAVSAAERERAAEAQVVEDSGSEEGEDV